MRKERGKERVEGSYVSLFLFSFLSFNFCVSVFFFSFFFVLLFSSPFGRFVEATHTQQLSAEKIKKNWYKIGGVEPDVVTMPDSFPATFLTGVFSAVFSREVLLLFLCLLFYVAFVLLLYYFLLRLLFWLLEDDNRRTHGRRRNNNNSNNDVSHGVTKNDTARRIKKRGTSQVDYR